MFDCHQTRMARMFELVMRAFYPHQLPSFCFQPFDDVLAIHGVYYTHSRKLINSSEQN